MKSIFNIHLLSSISLEQKKDENNMELLKDLYNQIFVYNIDNMNELPNLWDSEENYILTEVLEIITHIVKNVIFSNLYYAIIKVTTKFIMSINPKTYENTTNERILKIYKGNKENYNLYVREIVDSIIKHNLECKESN